MATSPLDLNLGIDFGTQFTKVCVRDTALERSWVVTFTNGRPSLNEALISTKLGICSDGTLLAGLTQSEWQGRTEPISVVIDYIKMRLANIDLLEEGNQYPSDLLPNFNGSDLNSPENLENLCAYYLSSVILKAKQWVLQNNADLVKNQNINWSANIGVPVKYVDSLAIERFKQVLCLAWRLSESEINEPLPQSFKELQERMRQLRQNISYSQISCFAIPEIAAGVYSYTVSRQAQPGLYIFFDIGSGTIEGASFRFWRENEMPRVDFYSGEVEPLGVNALAKWVNSQVSGSKLQVEHDITNSSQKILQEIQLLSESIANSSCIIQGDFIANKFKVTERAIKKKLQSNIPPQTEKLLHLILGQSSIHGQVAKVIMTSKEKNREDLQKASSLIIFLGGGGRESQYYEDTIQSTYSACNHQYADVPPYQVEELPFPQGSFDMSGIERRYFHRFAVAYGLSIPEAEAPEVSLPSRFPPKPPQPFQPVTPEIGRYPDDHSSM